MTDFEKTRIVISGLTVMEPVTMLTDLLVSGVCLYAFFKLRQLNSGAKTVRLFSVYFLLLAIATAYGGIIGHGFLHLLSFEWKMPGWLISMASVTILERAVITHARPYLKPNVGNFLIRLNLFELGFLTAVVLVTMNFFFVEVHAAYGLLAMVSVLELIVFLKTRKAGTRKAGTRKAGTRKAGSRLMLIAVGISSIAALVHLSEFSPHRWFNFLDLSHVVMAVSAYVFYVGARKVHEDQVLATKQEFE